MPADALPVPPRPETNIVKEYRDHLGQPLTGGVTVKRVDGGQPVSATVPLDEGKLALALGPGTYELRGTLRPQSGPAFWLSETIVVTA